MLILLACATPTIEADPAPTDPSEPAPLPADELPPTAKKGLVEQLRADRAAPRHPSDGQGRAWLIEGDDPIQASAAGSWTLGFEVGELGVAAEGAVFLQISPFWGWSDPQLSLPGAPGYTVVSTEAADLQLDAEVIAQGLVAIRPSRALTAGEQLQVQYQGHADRYAEDDARFWFAVDGDGDGVRRTLPDGPGVTVTAGPAARIVLTVPSTAKAGDTVELTVAVLDAAGNAGVQVDTPLELAAQGLAVPEAVTTQGGLAKVELTVPEAGVYRVLARHGEIYAESNPLVVGFEGATIRWADLHGHSQLSDGTGTPEAFLRYARDVAALDVVSLTDHDHWGLLPLSEVAAWWDEIQAATKAAHEPGSFVPLLGYEWTSWIHGHRHVLHFDDTATICDSTDPACESPTQLWDSLRGQDALTFAHHQSGGPIATNWDIPPDPELEPLTEIASVHGSSESRDTPRRIYSWVDGYSVRSALDRGYQLGFVGSGDSHDGHPGLPHLASGTGGLAAILTDELTREGVLAAMKARRTYATNGPRIVLRASLGGQGLGADVTPNELSVADLVAVAVGVGPLDRIDLIQDGEVVATHPCEGERTCRATWQPTLKTGGYLYVRAVQQDGGAAWGSPWFVQ